MSITGPLKHLNSHTKLTSVRLHLCNNYPAPHTVKKTVRYLNT